MKLLYFGTAILGFLYVFSSSPSTISDQVADNLIGGDVNLVVAGEISAPSAPDCYGLNVDVGCAGSYFIEDKGYIEACPAYAAFELDFSKEGSWRLESSTECSTPCGRVCDGWITDQLYDCENNPHNGPWPATPVLTTAIGTANVETLGIE